jgi:energy-converting hydrogenase Eha subunit A
MLRAILSVIVGFVVVCVVVVACFTALQLGLGNERVFKPGSWEPSTLFNIAALVIGVVAAIIAGYVCAAIARSPRPPLVLASLLLLFGLVTATMNVYDNRPMTPRPANATPMDAAEHNREPVWMPFANAVIGFAGVMIGARLRRPPAHP